MIRKKLHTKTEVVKRLCEDTGMPKPQASFVFDVMFDIIRKDLSSGKEVLLPGIGRICFFNMNGGRSNMTGQIIPKHKRIGFKPNNALARLIRVKTRETPIN